MQQRNDELLRAMYEEYQAVLRRVARKSGIPDCDVDDMIQETFLAYFRSYPLDWTPRQKKAMVMRILKNKCADYFRRNKNIECVSMDAEEFDEMEILSEYTMRDVLERLLAEETYEEVQNDIKAMKRQWRDVAILGLVEERSTAEICAILEIESTVCRMRLSRIRKYLRQRHGPKGKT